MRRSMDVDANVCVAVTLALAAMFTAARFWARYITKVKLWVDDWFALAAFVSDSSFV
jgi:NO-binding membrane sensor protein with MHYT domain